jgi:hypothetical protein
MSAAEAGSTCISADFQELVLAVSMAHNSFPNRQI